MYHDHGLTYTFSVICRLSSFLSDNHFTSIHLQLMKNLFGLDLQSSTNRSQLFYFIIDVVVFFFSYFFFLVKLKFFLQELLDGQKGWSSSDHSQDYGYSSENNIGSSGHSNPSSPEGSEVACSDGFCNHEGSKQLVSF